MSRSLNRKVFIVHGHDNAVKEAVARYLENLRFEPIILNEQIGVGHTIIEMIERHSDVNFAVVLLTPDDQGSLKSSPADAKGRARQNVIFEFGYFIGKLGRSKVLPLKKGDIEILSDLGGILYTEFDDHGAWKRRLAHALDQAGFTVDFTKA